jgi:cold shock CspA family protein
MDDVFTISEKTKPPRYVGTVIRFDERLGCGVIVPDGRQAQIYVHRTQVVGGNLLVKGERVSFYQDRSPRGFLARAVKRTADDRAAEVMI